MPSDLTPFHFPETGDEIRAVIIDGDPWFVAADVARALGYARPADAVTQHVDDEDRATTADHRSGLGGPERVIINESGPASRRSSSTRSRRTAGC